MRYATPALVVIFLLSLVALPAPAPAQGETQRWGEAGGWDVLVDPSLGYGCFIEAVYQDGSLVRIGFDRNRDTGYVLVVNEKWGTIEPGGVYDVVFDLDEERYEAEAEGYVLGGVPGLDINFQDHDFLFDLARRYTMTLYHQGSVVMAIDLEGTYAGLQSVMECQAHWGTGPSE